MLIGRNLRFLVGPTTRVAIHNSVPMPHAICVAAIECGLASTIKVAKRNAPRSSQRAIPLLTSVVAMLSKDASSFAINAKIIAVSR